MALISFLLLALIVPPQDYTYDQIKALLFTEWELSGESFMIAFDKPELPGHPEEYK